VNKTKLEVNIYENKSRHYEHIYFIIKLYENTPGDRFTKGRKS
jgi:hypothetical protein